LALLQNGLYRYLVFKVILIAFLLKEIFILVLYCTKNVNLTIANYLLADAQRLEYWRRRVFNNYFCKDNAEGTLINNLVNRNNSAPLLPILCYKQVFYLVYILRSFVCVLINRLNEKPDLLFLYLYKFIFSVN
jgi:hypothetical protein